MDLLGMLRKFGDRLGIIEVNPVSPQPGAPVKVQTRSVTIVELATKIQITEVRELAGLPAELSVSFEDIFKAAGIQGTPAGWNVERLHEFLSSDRVRAMDRSEAQQATLRMLAAEKVDAADLIKDAIARDQALDAYQDFISKKTESRIRALEQEIANKKERWREWRKHKRQREREMAHAIGYLIDGPVISIDEDAEL